MARLNFIEARDARGRQAPRRGIVLLFVLALLALFSLVTVTYVLVARQAKIGALVSSRVEQTGNTGQTNSQLDFALLQVLRGTNSPNSVMGPHSLLEDMYGSDGVVGTVVDGTVMSDGTTAADNPLSAQVLPSTVFGTQGQQFLVQLDGSTDIPMYMYDGAYNGRTVTMLNGAAAGRSSRILESFIDPDGSGTLVTVPSKHTAPNLIGPTHRLRVMRFGAPVNVGDRVLINGAPFNGTGFGFGFPLPAPTAPPTLYLGSLAPNPPSPLPPLDLHYALLPNPKYFQPNKQVGGVPPTVQPPYSDFAGPGGADESYDAVDYQNMLLALYVPDAIVDTTRSDDVPVPLPSLHRPELIFYWMVKSGALATAVTTYPSEFPTTPTFGTITPAQTRRVFQLMEYGDPNATPPVPQPLAKGVLRRIMLRPWGGPDLGTDMPTDHPQFTGGNPNFNPLSLGSLNDVGRWDVDNDQDGIHDSVWVDLGAPVQTAADGRKFKALYAILVVDEDSRLNANAHGSLAHFDTTMTPMEPINVLDTNQGFRAGPYADNLTGIQPNNPLGKPYTPYLSMGQGYGPADINIAFLFDAPVGAANATLMRQEAGRLLAGGTTPSGRTVEGRYGEVSLLPGTPSPGTTGEPVMDTSNPQLSTGDWLDDFVRNGDMSYNFFQAGKAPVGPFPSDFGSYGSPPDLNGDSVLGLDVRGQPWYGDVNNLTDPPTPGQRPDSSYTPIPGFRYFAGFGEWNSQTWNDKLDDPYEMILSVYHTAFQPSQASRLDNPFSPTELERLRRFNDVDASSLASRLTIIGQEAFVNGAGNIQLDAARRRGLLTTESWDTPVPSTILPNDLVLGLLQTTPTGYTPELNATQGLLANNAQLVNSATGVTFNELVRRRLAQQNIGYDFTKQQRALAQLVSWDLARGERLDLNRPFGNGVDDAPSDNYIDSPTEAANGDVLWSAFYNKLPLTLSGGPFADVNNDGITLGDGAAVAPFANSKDGLARQLLARHLYVLAWTVVDPTQGSVDALAPLAKAGMTNPRQIRRNVARRLAQWAVNMVDFRDRDSVMTAFEYDVDPFTDGDPLDPLDDDGIVWDVDDDPATDPNSGDTGGITVANAQDRGVVWGCERPELLMTETGAFHDLRIDDRANDSNSASHAVADGDTTFDQVMRPLGSLFIELYAPWNSTEVHAPELYEFQPQILDPMKKSFQLNLSKVAPDGSPVWRIVVAKDVTVGEYPEKNEWNGAPPLGANTAIERTIYFIPDPTTLTPPKPAIPVTDHRRPYYRPIPVPAAASLPDVLIPANSYAVIGPAENDNATMVLMDAAIGAAPATSKIQFSMLETTEFKMAGTLVTPYPSTTAPDDKIKRPLAVVVNYPRRLSLSEPYPKQVFATSVPAIPDIPADPGDGKYAAWDAVNHVVTDQLPTADDSPWDDITAFPVTNGGLPLSIGTTNGDRDVHTAGSSHRALFLQRLADPTQPWDRKKNPYLSVDRMPVDLTVYNSVTNQQPPAPWAAAGTYRFGTRQRGKLEVTGVNTAFNIWSNNPCEQPKTTATPASNVFNHTLGYLNDPTKLAVVPSTATLTVFPLRIVNGTPGAGETANTYGNDDYIGAPTTPPSPPAPPSPQVTPFPWLTWNNRPYISKHELLLVPAVEPYELLIHHSARHPSTTLPITEKSLTTADKSPYLLAADSAGAKLDFCAGLQYGYLSPLMMSSWVMLPEASPTTPFTLPNLHRLLEFVTVPSRFAGTETYLDPTTFAASTSGTASGHHFNPPFNRLSSLREPGKVNINTVTDLKVWQAIMNQLPDGSPTANPSVMSWQKLVTSRRGFGPNAGTFPILDPTVPLVSNSSPTQPLPTFFANPFRSYGGLYLVPIPELQTVNFATLPTFGTLAHASVSSGVWQNEIDSTLLRADQSLTAFGGARQPLFAQNPTGPADTPLYADALVNPYFHYQNIQKLSNLVTTRSNVYSVWITVGYFEVTRVPEDGTVDATHPLPPGWQGHPDGWALGAEMGLDSGKVERHRAFYIIDRSLPVAFQRGQDNNVDNAVLLRRVIE